MTGGVLHVDCDRCTVRGAACGECVISVLLGPPDDFARVSGARDIVDAGPRVSSVDLDTDEQAALAALAGSGLVPPLRLVMSVAARDQAADVEQSDWDDGWGDGAAQDWA